MGQLETLILPTDTVEFNGVTLELRGLGLADITYIIRHHGGALGDLYEEATAGKLEGSVTEIALKLQDDFAPLAGMVIAQSMDDPKNAAKAAKLPLSVQAEALEKIVHLTLIGEGGLEKLMEIVVRALQGANNLKSRKALQTG
jgi:hypothetical protein